MASISKLINSTAFQRFIIAVILANAAILGVMTTDVSPETMRLLYTLDMICLAVFVVEIALKVVVMRLSMFRDPWNVFDVIVVGDCFASCFRSALRSARASRLAVDAVGGDGSLNAAGGERHVCCGSRRGVSCGGIAGHVLCGGDHCRYAVSRRFARTFRHVGYYFFHSVQDDDAGRLARHCRRCHRKKP